MREVQPVLELREQVQRPVMVSTSSELSWLVADEQRGSSVSARGFAIRWRCPPENWCGYRRWHHLCSRDDVRSTIDIFSPDGAFLETWGEPGSGPGDSHSPGSLGFDADGNIYVFDTLNNRIQKFATDRTFLFDGALREPLMASSTKCRARSIRLPNVSMWPSS